MQEYFKEFQSLVQVLEHYRAAFGADGPTKNQVRAKQALVAVQRKSIAISFLKRADHKHYSGLWKE